MSFNGLIHRLTFLGAALALATAPAHARIGLVVGEPFGSFGTMMPAGHAGIYLDHVCAETPTHLRSCKPGEAGVVLSRYHDLRSTHLDWMAVPARTFFYGVDNPADTPGFVTPSLESEIRESYRDAQLLSVAPDRIDKHGIPQPPPYGDWQEAIGAAFDRRLFIYSIDTTPEQDATILEALNTAPDRRHYSLFRANCADFAADLLNLALPGTFHRNNVADFQMMSPKQLARLMINYSHAHPDINLTVYEVPQLPGTLRRSRPLRGAAETLLKTKRYLVTLLVIQPELVFTSWIIYEAKGKSCPGEGATALPPGTLPPPMHMAYSPASTSSSTASDSTGPVAK